MDFKHRVVNVAIQVLPISKTREMYDMVDAAIAVIQKSGLKHEVTPFETVVEGPYIEVMALVEAVQCACYDSGAEKLICNLKIQSHQSDRVSIDDKIEKYR